MRNTIKTTPEDQIQFLYELDPKSPAYIPSQKIADYLGIERKTLQAWVRDRPKLRKIARRFTQKGDIFFRWCDFNNYCEQEMSTLAV
jgi:hypothetical protein